MNFRSRYTAHVAPVSLAIAFVLLPAIDTAQQTASPTVTSSSNEPIILWPEGAPHAIGKADEDIPRLVPYVSARVRTTTAVLVIPDGGYAHLSLPTEGLEIAQFLNAAGIPAFVLEYRLGPRYRYPTQLDDAATGDAVHALEFRQIQHSEDWRHGILCGRSPCGDVRNAL